MLCHKCHREVCRSIASFVDTNSSFSSKDMVNSHKLATYLDIHVFDDVYTHCIC